MFVETFFANPVTYGDKYYMYMCNGKFFPQQNGDGKNLRMVWFFIGQIYLKQVLHDKNLFTVAAKSLAKDIANAYEPTFVVPTLCMYWTLQQTRKCVINVYKIKIMWYVVSSYNVA